MKEKRAPLDAVIGILITLCMLLAVGCRQSSAPENPPPANPTPANPPSQTHTGADLDSMRQSAEHQVRPDIENERKADEQQAQQSLDKDAIAAIDQTHKAIDDIAANKTDDAVHDIEQATGKINILLARNPSTALIPVYLEVAVIDTAPLDSKAVEELVKGVSKAVGDKDFPVARVLLADLMSELRVRTYNLPLATYPAALTQAARLLDQKATSQASNVLLTALNTLVVIDRVTPLPLLVARAAIDAAQAQQQKDKNAALTLLEVARASIQRSKELGYAPKDPEYAALNDDISNLEKQLKGGGDVSAFFSKLKERFAGFLKRQSNQQRH